MIKRYKLPSALVEGLRWQSVPLDDVARRAGLSRELLRGPDALLTGEQLLAFWKAVGDISVDPVIGLTIGSDARIERLCVVSMAALSASSFREGLARMARYNQLAWPGGIHVATRGQECVVRCLPSWGGLPCTVLEDMCLARVAALARRGTAGAVRPIRLEVAHARSPRLYEEHFGCPVRATRCGTALFFRATDLDHPFDTRNDALFRLLVPQLDAEVAARQAGDDTRDQVKAVLRRSLIGHRPNLGNVARELASSRRTLQRRLASLGASFHQLLEEARRDCASRYLVCSSLRLAQIAHLLGYKDANSFVRAFTQWEGVPPGRWREMRRAGAPDRIQNGAPDGEPGSVHSC